MVITTAQKASISPASLAKMTKPQHILMVHPEFFDVTYVINPHMEGNIGGVDRRMAVEQWENLHRTFVETGANVHVVDGVEDLPDMVFCANQSLPFISTDGTREVLMSRMHSPQRRDEVPYIASFYRSLDFKIHHFPEGTAFDFEGMGDALWHPGKRLIWGGYGYRSSLEAYKMISEMWDVPVIALELTDPDFYHLDTCLCFLDEQTALFYPKAFTDEGLALLRTFIPRLIETSEADARHNFACNAFSPDGKNVVIHRGSDSLETELRDAGFNVIPVDTGEYLKSGGSVFCMKMMFW